jgi:hypothetical protein
MSSIVPARPLVHHKLSSQWLPVMLARAMGYSSFIAAIVSMILYWYKKHSLSLDKEQAVRDGLHLNHKKKLHITTANHRISSSLKRTSSTFTNLTNEGQVCRLFLYKKNL